MYQYVLKRVMLAQVGECGLVRSQRWYDCYGAHHDRVGQPEGSCKEASDHEMRT